MAIMIGVIITVRITIETISPVPERLMTYWTDFLRASETRWSLTNGTRTRIPIRP